MGEMCRKLQCMIDNHDCYLMLTEHKIYIRKAATSFEQSGQALRWGTSPYCGIIGSGNCCYNSLRTSGCLEEQVTKRRFC
jgi:hypothetical protein